VTDQDRLKQRIYDLMRIGMWYTVTDVGTMLWFPFRNRDNRAELEAAIADALRQLVHDCLIEERPGMYRRPEMLEALGLLAD